MKSFKSDMIIEYVLWLAENSVLKEQSLSFQFLHTLTIFSVSFLFRSILTLLALLSLFIEYCLVRSFL